MKSSVRMVGIVVLLLLVAGLGFFAGRHGVQSEHDAAASDPPEEQPATATVTAARVKQGAFTQTFTAYGSVTADPGDVRALSVQYESHVARVFVTSGQPIDSGTELIALEPSPDTKEALIDAQNAAAAADRNLKQTQDQFNSHLATNQDLAQSQEAQRSANLKLQSMLERGVDKPQHLQAPISGIVSKIDVQQGQIVPAGAPLIEVAAQNRLVVKLGVEPDDAQILKPDQPVALRSVESESDQPIQGRIRVIGNRIDPTTRLVDVLVALPADTKLILDSFISAELPRTTVHGLIVPRQALLSEQDGYSLFTIKDGHAYEHDVNVRAQSDDQAVIDSDDVKEDDEVALVGSLELEDKMAVEITEASTEPSSAPTKPDAGSAEESK